MKEASREEGGGGRVATGMGDAGIWKQWRESKKRADELEMLNVKLKEEQEFLNSTIVTLKSENQELQEHKAKSHVEQDIVQIQAELEDRQMEMIALQEENADLKEKCKELVDAKDKLSMELELVRKESSISVNIASDKLGELESGMEQKKREN